MDRALERALFFVAQRGWTASEAGFFAALADFLHRELPVDVVLIAELLDDARGRSLARIERGEYREPIEYELPGTPCAQVAGRTLCSFHTDVHRTFPEDEMLVDLGVESYVGIPLWASDGEPLGLIAVMGAPLAADDAATIEAVLQIVAVRCAHEIERLHTSDALLRLADSRAVALRFAGLQAEISTALVDLPVHQVDDVVNASLRDIAREFRADQATLSFREPASEHYRVTHEYGPAGQRQTAGPRYPWLFSQLVDRGGVVLEDLPASLPLEAEQERVLCAERGIRSALCLGFTKNGRMFATLSLIALEERDWTEADLARARTLGELLVGAVLRRDAEREKASLARQMAQTQKLESLGMLAGGIAHDFNNIFASILGLAKRVQKDLPRGSDADRDVTEIVRALDRATDLAEAVLVFSRQPGQDLGPSTPAHAPVLDAVELLRRSIPGHVALEAEISGEADEVPLEASQVYQLVVNLCTNAWQAIGDRAGLVRIELSSLQLRAPAQPFPSLPSGEYVVISVSDDGPGIAPEIRDRLFEPFFTTRDRQGTGLGLAVVNGIVRGVGGAIAVETEPGAGATFRLCIPRARPRAELPKAENPGPGVPLRILLVDDEPVLLRVTGRALSAMGHQVEGFSSSLEALAAVEQNPGAYDLLITDESMPDLTGQALVRAARLHKPELRSILVTGYGAGLSGAEADRVLIKPFQMGELEEAITGSARRTPSSP